MDLDKLGHLPLALLPATTETHVFSELQNTFLISVGQLYDDDFQAILNKKNQVVENKLKHHSHSQLQHVRWSIRHPTDTDSSNSAGSQCHCTD